MSRAGGLRNCACRYAPFRLNGPLNRAKLTVREFEKGNRTHYAWSLWRLQDRAC